MAARKRRSSRQKVSLSISLRTACPPLKACRRANSSRQSLFFRLVHFTDVRYWHIADIPLCTAHVRYWGQSGHIVALHMSAFDPKRTLLGPFASVGLSRYDALS